jgi:hypothetical protein
MRKYLLIITAFICYSQAVYAGDIDFKKPLIEGEYWQWLNLGMVLLILGFIVFIAVVRRLFAIRLGKHKAADEVKKAPGKKDNIYEPRYWYQCRNCRLTIRKDSPPNTADCFKAVDHRWTQLAEVGQKKYLCKKCNTLIATRAVPVNDNCPEGDEHNWEMLL